ncbi:MAG: response regulator transcription factor [Chloroflexota bacterium]|nr:response regulator transcription factor [Chloroflexota bacterium]
MSPIRVVLADDHAVVRKGIREFLEEDPEIEVVAEASNGEKVKALILQYKPDVAVLDVRMPSATGIEVTTWIRSQALSIGVLILSAFDDDPFVIAAVQAGANGYVLKNAEAEQIIDAVRRVSLGQSVIPAEIAESLIRHMIEEKNIPSAPVPERLTEREREVLQLAAAGLTNRGIGIQLSISDRTVQGHLASIYAKLTVGSRTEAVTKALQIGAIQLRERNA